MVTPAHFFIKDFDMELVISGCTATLFDGGREILRIHTKNDVLTSEILDINKIEHVQIKQLADHVHQHSDDTQDNGLAPQIVCKRI